MSYVWAHGKDLDDINDAIKTKTGSQSDYTIDQMATAIDNINEAAINLINSHLSKNIISFNSPSITTIGEEAFRECTSLTTVNLPSVTYIDKKAFDHCTSLTTVNLPSVTYINEQSFSGCNSLTSITLSGSTMCVLENQNAFGGVNTNNLHIYVPSNLLDSYTSDNNWRHFSDQLIAITE